MDRGVRAAPEALPGGDGDEMGDTDMAKQAARGIREDARRGRAGNRSEKIRSSKVCFDHVFSPADGAGLRSGKMPTSVSRVPGSERTGGFHVV